MVNGQSSLVRSTNWNNHTLNRPCSGGASIACSPSMVCWRMAPLILLTVRDSSKTLPRLFTGSSDTVGIRCSATSKNTSLRMFPLTRARLLDFAGLKAIRHHPNRLFNLSRVFWTTFFLFMIRVVSSMNDFIGGMYTPLPMCASGILDPAAFSRICIASTKREGEIVHPIAIPTSRGTPLWCTSWRKTASWTR